MPAPDQVPLPYLSPGETGRVEGVGGGWGAAGRLAALGVLPGRKVTVVANDARGPLVVAVGSTRIAVGRGLAAKILVSRSPGKA
ncbi:MAG: ferrous iron transport protein A [Firmicutes bacterium]|nr:ferrous iron transport protein A [Bacillota bacterium]